MNPEATRAQLRRGTLDYIAMDPTDIVLHTVERTRVEDGSWMETPGPDRDVQTFKLISIEFTPQGQVVTRTDNDGVERVIGFYLLGAYDAAMAPRDWWIGADGRRYTIIALMDGHGYELKGAVEAHG